MSGTSKPLSFEAARLLTTDPGPYLSCDDCFRLADRFVEILLSTHIDVEPHAGGSFDTTALTAHLGGCPACLQEMQSLILLAAEDAGIAPAVALGRLG